MNIQPLQTTNDRFFAFNKITGCWWDGSGFNANSSESIDPSVDWSIPSHAVPVMRATWMNVGFIPAGSNINIPQSVVENKA